MRVELVQGVGFAGTPPPGQSAGGGMLLLHTGAHKIFDFWSGYVREENEAV